MESVSKKIVYKRREDIFPKRRRLAFCSLVKIDAAIIMPRVISQNRLFTAMSFIIFCFFSFIHFLSLSRAIQRQKVVFILY